MPDPRYNRIGRTDPWTWTLFVVLGLVVVVVGIGYAALRLGEWFSPSPADVPTNPFAAMGEVLAGDLVWRPVATRCAVAIVAVLLLAGIAVMLLIRRRHGRSAKVDRAARVMASRRDIARRAVGQVSKTAKRFGVDTAGVAIGKAVRTGQWVYGTWEETQIDIWGPRRGKTTARVIPIICAAPAATIATSNKRDLVDATRGVRDALGRVWVFDTQQLAGEEPTWWWNPLSYVTDEVQADKLAATFAGASRASGARTDAHFEPAGQMLLAGLLLAAAEYGHPITQVFTWLSDDRNDDAVRILRDRDYQLTADQVEGVLRTADKERSSIYSTSRRMVAWLTNRKIAEWICPRGIVDDRPQFDPATFVTSTDTIYLLSREGQGNAGPIVTALTVAILEAAEDYAATCAWGRLPTPMTVVLDEVANVCRWHDLPNQYSHYGSRGIIPIALLQSWSQGVDVWGREGMQKLWSAASVRVYGGGAAETDFLEQLSRLTGRETLVSSSDSYSQGRRTVSRSQTREQILSEAELAHLEFGRAVVYASGTPPILIETVPWSATRHAAAIRASIDRFDPGHKPAAVDVAPAAAVSTVAEAADVVAEQPRRRWWSS